VNVCVVNGEAMSEEEAFRNHCGVAAVAPSKQPDNPQQPMSPTWSHRRAR